MIIFIKSVIITLLLICFLLFTSCTAPGIYHPPQITSLTANPDTIAISQYTYLTCIATDPDGDNLTFTWNDDGDVSDQMEENEDDEDDADSWPDERIPKFSLNTRGTVTFYSWAIWGAPSTAGTYTVTCTVSDGRGGEDNDSVSITVLDTTPSPSGSTYSLCDIGPAGGYIFYDKGNYSDGWRYLEAAPVSTEWAYKEWGSEGNFIGATETGIGTGQSNTTKIVTWLNIHSETDRAAQLCHALTEGGYSDWFLPSKDELNLMYAYLKVFGGVGNFETNFYWSSSESDADSAWYKNFDNGYPKCSVKGNYLWVRAVRAF